MLTDQDSRDPLNWLSRILWPDRSTTIEAGGGRSSARWWASPSVENPKILIPARSTAAARTAVKRYHDGFSIGLRLRSLAAEGLMVLGPVAGVLLRNKRVGATPSTDHGSHRQAETGGGRVDHSVLDGIAELLGVPDLQVAVSLSTPKSNQKPVLQLLDGHGRCLGWAKVAWNERTGALVANEASWLQRRARPPLSIPELLHDVEIAGRRVAISSGVEPSRRPRRRAMRPPDVELFLAVAALGTMETAEVERTPWWRSVERVIDQATDRERAAMLGALESCAGLRFRIGAWHGDLTPWNLMTTADRVHLIDWEFAADGVPIGFDLCHFHTQAAAEMRNRPDRGLSTMRRAAEALDHSARLSPRGLADLGVEPQNRLPIWRLYLVELLRRYVALRSAGYPVDEVTQGPAALDRLERALGFVGLDAGDDRPPGAVSDAEPESAVSPANRSRRSSDGVAEADRPPTDEPLEIVDGQGFTIRDRRAGVTGR